MAQSCGHADGNNWGAAEERTSQRPSSLLRHIFHHLTGKKIKFIGFFFSLHRAEDSNQRGALPYDLLSCAEKPRKV